MKRSEFLKSSALMGTGIVVVPSALSCTEKNTMDKKVMPSANDRKKTKRTLKDEFITTVDLSNNDSWQFLYGSQLYGTTFGVFGKFNTKPIEGKERYQINYVDLKLINYKGDVSIGFYLNNDLPEENDWINETWEKEWSDELINSIRWNPRINVKGGLTSFEKKLTPNNVVVGKQDLVLFNRMLYPLNKEKSGDKLPEEVPGDGFKEEPDSHNVVIFDSEFYQRDGYFIRKKRKRDGHFDDPRDFPSRRCHQALVGISF